MKMTKKLVITAAVLPMVLATASVSAFGGKSGHGAKDGHGGMRKGSEHSLISQLDLTAEQQQQLRDMREAKRSEHYDNRDARMEENKAHHEAMQALVLADTFDQAAAEKLAKEMVEQQTERRVQKLAHQHKMFSILTADQKEQLKELRTEHMENMSGKRAGHKGKGRCH